MTEDETLMESALRRAAILASSSSRPALGITWPTYLANCLVSRNASSSRTRTRFAVAGKDVHDNLRASGRKCLEPLVLEAHGLYAEYSFVTRIQNALANNDAIPVAVGSGSINDLTKLASHLCGRQYLSVATAASMDGYTAFGASITHEGSKQTFDCPAPLGVVADLEVIAAAPEGLNASGYADLVAKVPAGLDWLLADCLGVDAIDPDIWDMVQSRLDVWMSDPDGVRAGDLEVTRRLTDRAHDHRLRDAGLLFEPARLRRRAPVQPPVGHGAPHLSRHHAVARLQSRHRFAGVARAVRSGPGVRLRKPRCRRRRSSLADPRRRTTRKSTRCSRFPNFDGKGDSRKHDEVRRPRCTPDTA